jgi:integrase
MIEQDGRRDLGGLVVHRLGSVRCGGDPWEPFVVTDVDGRVVEPARVFLRELLACGRSEGTLRAYSIALLRWFRFLGAVGVTWDQATRAEARDFCLWIRVAVKPAGGGGAGAGPGAGARNRVTGKAAPGAGYGTATAVHSESVLRGFYEFHRDAGTGPMVNPFPLSRGRRTRPRAGGSLAGPPRAGGAGLYRPRPERRAPHHIPDSAFGELFAGLGSDRDRALVALWVSTGARASELLGAVCGDADPGQQLITVVRKGTRRLQPLPASPDAFVWLRLYQAQVAGLVPAGPDDPLWWTLRRPFRQLGYQAAYRMFRRANASIGANWSLHDLRHLAAYRMARDPQMPLADVQWVLGHAHLTTTQLYLSVPDEEVIASALAHHARMASGPALPAPPGPGYRPETLDVLFGEGRW